MMSHLLCSQDTRTHVVGELYDTERSYVESLQILVEKYMKPLKSLESNRVLIESVLVDEIFHSIPEILQHHENFLGALQDRLSSDWDSSQVIGNVFIEAIIDDYTTFINNWKNARQAIKVATQAKPAFERFLEAMSREHRNKLTLDALLIMPVQRIPRYELLIKELIKHTPEDHPDRKPLMEAQKKIHELALKIDRAEREMIHQEQLRDLEALIEGHVELQHHQRDFIRYDLVTIVGASALTATKKDRVLFLFCDLLIMTSIKKKASRRSNLQNAFANSTNDLSLLEGNKFKLLLRVPLDQIEIRLDYDQIQLHQQHQEEQQHFQLQRQNKLIQERRREIETDLQTLQQIESLAATLSHVHRIKLDDVIIEMLTDLKQILTSIEHNDMQMLSGEQQQHSANTLSQYSVQDLYLTPSPASIASSASNQQQLPQSQSQANTNNNLQNNNNNNSSSSSNNLLLVQTHHQAHSPVPSNHHHHHQDSNTSLEFLINNSGSQNNGITSKDSTNDFLSLDHQSYIGQTVADNMQQLMNSSNQSSSLSNCESLVVTFPSIERRQAFIQAFMEAKQQRYQQKQQQQQQQHHQAKIFSSSVTLKLAPPATQAAGVQEKRSSAPDPKLHHQESADAYLASARVGQRPSSLSASTTSRISSSTPFQHQFHQPSGSVIVHQMSAPQSLASSSIETAQATTEEGRLQCASCSYNLVAEAEKAQLSHHHHQHHHQHHHHHHQLMHQPASQPASLDTICCHDPHNNWNDEQRKQLMGGMSSDNGCNMNSLDNNQSQAHRCMNHNHQELNISRHFGLNSVVNLNSFGGVDGQAGSGYKSTTLGGNGEDQTTASGQQLIDQMNFNLLLANCAPKFLVTLPVDFLSTQHPALQFTCSALGRQYNRHSSSALKLEEDLRGNNDESSSSSGSSNLKSKRSLYQTVNDNLGQLWLCMSNGYVSHVALVTIKKREQRRTLGSDGQPEQACSGGHNSSLKGCYSITPVVISAGDICKAHINCAAQVKWARSSSYSESNTALEEPQEHDKKFLSTPSKEELKNDEVGPPIETLETTVDALEGHEEGASVLNSQSPPIEIKCKNHKRAPLTKGNAKGGDNNLATRLSESAPSPSPLSSSRTATGSDAQNSSSASTTRLDATSSSYQNDRSGIIPSNHHQNLHRHHHHHHQHHNHSHNLRSFNMQYRPGNERKRSIHDEICHRHYNHQPGCGNAKHLNNRASALSSAQQIPRTLKNYHHHHHHRWQSAQHHNHHYNHHHHHQHSHHHPHQHNRSHAHQPNQHIANIQLRHRLNHGGHTHSHQHHQQQQQPQQSQAQQQQQQQQHHSSQLHRAYGSRNNTVPIADLRRGLSRQDTIEQQQQRRPTSGQFLSPQASSQKFDAASRRSNSAVLKCEKTNSIDLAEQRQRSLSPKTARPTTPTSLASASMRGFRSARLMRHQASLKTSSILAKLVGSATRRSAYVRKSNTAHDRSSDLDDNDTTTDTDSGQQCNILTSKDSGGIEQANLDSNKNESTNSYRTSSQQLDSAMIMAAYSNNNNNNNSAVISPLSSVSSLNSTTSSFTVNSVCASSPNHSSCELLAHSYSTTCCIGGSGINSSSFVVADPNNNSGYNAGQSDRGGFCGHRSRSATAPSRPLCNQMLSPADCPLTHHKSFTIVDPKASNTDLRATSNSMSTTTTTTAAGRPYKVSEILNDTPACQNKLDGTQEQQRSANGTNVKRLSSGTSRVAPSSSREMNSSLWLGCDDGSLIIIDCLTANDDPQSCTNNSSSNNLDPLSQGQKTFTCGNVHSEIKLNSSICDISTYKDEKVFVALSNGQLAVFSRIADKVLTGGDDCGANKEMLDAAWSLTNPEIIAITEKELNSTSRLCQIDENFLWYSYGRNIFVLNISTLKLETTIMAPTNDLSLRLTVLSMTIENMELMQNLSGVWVSFKNSHLIQFYDIQSYKLLVEINLFDPINKLLSYGNEIIRQHKTACLKATSLLNYYNEREKCNTLFVGTSAGIILYLTISADQLASREPNPDWKPQIVSLRHGHSGHVKLLRLIQINDDLDASVELKGEEAEQQPTLDGNNNIESSKFENNLYLISGGTGLDIYGPSGEQQNFISQLNSDEDSLNHLMIWQL